MHSAPCQSYLLGHKYFERRHHKETISCESTPKIIFVLHLWKQHLKCSPIRNRGKTIPVQVKFKREQNVSSKSAGHLVTTAFFFWRRSAEGIISERSCRKVTTDGVSSGLAAGGGRELRADNSRRRDWVWRQRIPPRHHRAQVWVRCVPVHPAWRGSGCVDRRQTWASGWSSRIRSASAVAWDTCGSYKGRRFSRHGHCKVHRWMRNAYS